MKIDDEVYVHGYVDEIRKDMVIIRNAGGYFGTVPNEIICSEMSEQKKQKTGKSMRLIDVDALEREGWSLCRTFQKDKSTMVHEVKKPSDFTTIFLEA